MGIIYFFFYLLPMMLMFVVVYLIMSIVRKKKRAIVLSIVSIISISAILILYYFPKDNIMKNYNFNYIDIDSWNMSRIKITNQQDINKILKVINKHTFIRSAVRTVEDERFPGNELTIISMHDKGKIFHLYILEDQIEKNVLQVNMQMYNVKDKDGISKEIIHMLKELVNEEK